MITKLYQWHRWMGILVVLPVLGWCLSGLTHPIMAHFLKVKPAQRFAPAQAIELDSNSIALEDALAMHLIDSFENIRIINFEKGSYYQILRFAAPCLYINTTDGALLENGEEHYAKYLARYYIGDQTSEIRSVERVERFTFEYKFINRLLPAYKVSFDRDDAMDVYVETASSRLGTLNDWNRKTCIAIFSYLHNWSFLNALPTLKLILLVVLMVLTMGVAVTGVLIYGVLWKKVPQRSSLKSRKWHRRIGLLVALSSFFFAFSGAYHALAKVKTGEKGPQKQKRWIPRESVEQLPALFAKLQSLKNVSIAKMTTGNYFQVQLQDGKRTILKYYNVNTLEELSEGDATYATDLASYYTGLPQQKINSIEPVTKFGGEYGFINKRLPVVKISYDLPEKDAVYIETHSGKLATQITASKRLEALSFLMLHKYHFLDPFGKKVRDVIIVAIILAIMLVNVLGLIMWLRK